MCGHKHLHRRVSFDRDWNLAAVLISNDSNFFFLSNRIRKFMVNLGSLHLIK